MDPCPAIQVSAICGEISRETRLSGFQKGSYRDARSNARLVIAPPVFSFYFFLLFVLVNFLLTRVFPSTRVLCICPSFSASLVLIRCPPSTIIYPPTIAHAFGRRGDRNYHLSVFSNHRPTCRHADLDESHCTTHMHTRYLHTYEACGRERDTPKPMRYDCDDAQVQALQTISASASSSASCFRSKTTTPVLTHRNPRR
jgi:hypothetical protein